MVMGGGSHFFSLKKTEDVPNRREEMPFVDFPINILTFVHSIFICKFLLLIVLGAL